MLREAEGRVLPRVVVGMRKAVRRLTLRAGDEGDLSGAETEAHWQAMMNDVAERDREIEQRLAAAERALNRLSLR